MTFIEWLYEKYSGCNWQLYIKRLSANDTGASGGHQVGVYFSNEFLASVFPSIDTKSVENPSVNFTSLIVSPIPQFSSTVRAIYYNNKFFGKTRNEKRITRWGGKQSPIQNVDLTGAAVVFAFNQFTGKDASNLEVWVCSSLAEETELETFVGEVVPGEPMYGQASKLLQGVGNRYDTTKVTEIPAEWANDFPTGLELVSYVSENLKSYNDDPDKLLMKRRDAEYLLFKKIEENLFLQTITDGFKNMDEFMATANSVSNRRKSRAGRSLELHLEKIFTENGVTKFSTQANTEGNKKPDFIFPGISCYRDNSFPDSGLRMLAVKTTCKDRWRQILNEANRIKIKHLFTMQHGVSENQFQEMKDAGVKLVVPKPLHDNYPKSIRGELLSLSEFIEELKSIDNELN